MRHLSARLSVLTFALCVAMLCLIAYSANYYTERFALTSTLVSHTRQVETALARIRSDLYKAESARMGYILLGDESRLDRYGPAVEEMLQGLDEIKALTVDNPTQQQRVEGLRPIIQERVALMQHSIDTRKLVGLRDVQQNDFTTQGRRLTARAENFLGAMEQEEQQLLKQRQASSVDTYQRVRRVLALALFLVVALFVTLFLRLVMELRDRDRAESAVRRLSARLLQLQDDERRRIARELHDSLGQYLAGVKMSLSMLGEPGMPQPEKTRQSMLAECEKLVDQAISEARTLSHLLHPPLLDEAGFNSAARWYVDGFASRSKVQVSLEISVEKRMPREIELALFRVLQEALTNIHRHSGSQSAQARVMTDSHQVMMTIRDQGKGVPPETLLRFNNNGSGVGVGLAGMRERVAEFGGRLSLRQVESGTLLVVTIPLPRGSDDDGSVEDPPPSDSLTISDQPREKKSAGVRTV